MAAKKQGTPARSRASSGSSTAKKNAKKSAPRSSSAPRANTKSNTSKAKRAEPTVEQIRQRNQMEAVLWFAGAILVACFVLIPGVNVWLWIHNVLRGLFGNWAILLALLMVYVALSKAFERQGLFRGARMVLVCVILVCWCAAGHVFGGTTPPAGLNVFQTIAYLYNQGVEFGGAGLVGGLIGVPLSAAVGVTGARILILLVLFVAVMFLTGTSLAGLFRMMSRPAVAIHDVAQRRREERRMLEANPADIDVPLDAVLPQHPVRSIPETAESENKKRRKEKEKSPQLEKLERVFGLKSADPEQEPVVIREFDETSAGPCPVDKMLDANQQVPDFALPTLPPKEMQESAEKEPETPHVPVAHEVIEAPPAVPEKPAEAEMPVRKTVTVADNAARNLEAAADAEKAAAAFMQKKLEAEKKETQPLRGVQAMEESTYCFPPVTLLASSKKVDANVETEELQTNGKMLVETLKSFGVQTKIMDICRGPAVTRYELQPAAGVKISKITNLADDLAMNLAATGVRIEAPIPGKAAVGIEVPNKTKSIVRMRELIESNSFVTSKSHLTVALGRDIAGQVTVADLSKMPHVLIAGTTGSGKSVCINSLIVSLLYKSGPDDVRFLMIDPKVVELGIYNGIPHLLVPVVTDPRKAAGALNWAVTEMLKRYKIFAENNVRDLKGYNALAEANGYQDENGQPMHKMPQIVIIIDELSDLMMAAPNEVEDAICRLAQMARAAGMHLVVATQRPSVDVVTGLIKANIPSRIAFAVSSAVDSRTILDSGGAEKLLGQGDMLFSPVGAQKPLRIQGCFVSDSEIESVVDFVRSSKAVIYDEAVAEEIERNAAAEGGKSGDADRTDDSDSRDPMMNEAIKCVVEAGQASTSLLQRRLRLGYARAGRLIDEMEQMGIVGPHEGSKPRQVLITYAQWLEMNMQKPDEEI
ncbi:MAG: DNA translocase FtsK [Hominenteromicrobium sp.]